ncbi:RNA 2',3'-cyclic phosphodiesterase [Pseudoalteromonas peptidolytica]|uniref:RNA 2',3'-cyclic phosphodiesterase n=1 Tax=Pseudoalteromonas peptidolytica TaxID=61150 RepID=UPI00298E39F4|nr:RNA 2',3'-cyclic phosphodiesterase [Pseudoalteromonas peptidolytica]MDW7551524.1 RNA 2',3'-cyclic phosphodiesterase [Pseudoalteromonas peptidolytica]
MQKRLFFGIGMDDDARAHIGQWLVDSVSASKANTQPNNWHLTLAFLAMVEESKVAELCDFASTLTVPKFMLSFNEHGYWQHNGIFYLKPEQKPQALLDLANPLRAFGEKCDLYHNPHPFSPHITLFRNCKPEPTVAKPIAPFSLTVKKFHLYHSHRNTQGLIYDPIASFFLS